MPAEEGNENDSTNTVSETRNKPRRRPEVQIYRPGAFRGLDLSRQSAAKKTSATASTCSLASESKAVDDTWNHGTNEWDRQQDGRRPSFPSDRRDCADFRRGRLSSVASSNGSICQELVNKTELLPPASPRNYRMRQHATRNFVSSTQSMFDRPQRGRRYNNNNNNRPPNRNEWSNPNERHTENTWNAHQKSNSGWNNSRAYHRTDKHNGDQADFDVRTNRSGWDDQPPRQKPQSSRPPITIAKRIDELANEAEAENRTSKRYTATRTRTKAVDIPAKGNNDKALQVASESLNEVKSSFESLLLQNEEHFDWSAAVEKELQEKEAAKLALEKAEQQQQNLRSDKTRAIRLPRGKADAERSYEQNGRRTYSNPTQGVVYNSSQEQNKQRFDRQNQRTAKNSTNYQRSERETEQDTIRAAVVDEEEMNKRRTKTKAPVPIRLYDGKDRPLALDSERVPKDVSIAEHMERHVGRQIEMINMDIDGLIQQLSEKRGDETIAEELLAASERLFGVYESVIIEDIDYTYRTNLEQHLWKQCFYKPIEALKSGSNHFGDFAKRLRKHLVVLIATAQAFYKRLISRYEEQYGFSYTDFLYWQTGLPGDDLAIGVAPVPEANDRNVKLALLSLQRLFLALGDLHRYDAVVGGIKDYSAARIWYLRSAQLSPANGRSYNQLALLAVYAHRKSDIIFYYVRALAARHAFDTARQPLYSSLDDLRKRVDIFEQEINKRFGDIALLEVNNSRLESEQSRSQEIWIALDGEESLRKPDEDLYSSTGGGQLADMFTSSTSIELHRRSTAYLLHAAGLLITKIGMERFETVASRALQQLNILLSRSESPLTAMQLLQMTAVCLFAVHNAPSTEHEPGTCSLQQQRAVQLVISIWSLFLCRLDNELTNIEEQLLGKSPPSAQLLRVLPSLHLISEWMSTPTVAEIYRSMPSLEPVDPVNCPDTWKLLARVCNRLATMDNDGYLAESIVADTNGKDENAIGLVLPEHILTASFCGVFLGQPKVSRLFLREHPENRQLKLDTSLGTLHARLRALLVTAEYLDGSGGLACFHYDEELGQFLSGGNDGNERSLHEILHRRRSAASDDEEQQANHLDGEEGSIDDREESQYRRRQKEQVMKQNLLDKENVLRRVVIEVRPLYLVVDTNAFIDQLNGLKQIAETKKFTILMPTIVLTELTGLAQPPAHGNSSNNASSTAPQQQPGEDEWVGPQARAAIAYLKQQEGLKNSSFQTLTTRGNRLPSLMFAVEQSTEPGEAKKTTPDDLILASCVALASQQISAQSTSSSHSDNTQPVRLRRQLVLLTEDRGLAIKALSANIPVRTVLGFLKWAGIGGNV